LKSLLSDEGIFLHRKKKSYMMSGTCVSAIPHSTPHLLVDYLIFLGGFEEKYEVRLEFPEGQGGEGRSNQKFIFGDM